MKCIDCAKKGLVFVKWTGCKVLGIRRDWFMDRQCAGFVKDSEMRDTVTVSPVEVS